MNSSDICDRIMQWLDGIRIATTELAEEYELTKVQLVVMKVVQEHHRLSMGQLADILHCDASNVTGMVERLVKQGLLSRQPAESDRRTKMLTLTAKGTGVMTAIRAALPGRLHCDRLDATEAEQFAGLLRKLS
jgi:MarR family transcriptional regulator, organic hydroperoxide resistance regulator